MKGLKTSCIILGVARFISPFFIYSVNSENKIYILIFYCFYAILTILSVIISVVLAKRLYRSSFGWGVFNLFIPQVSCFILPFLSENEEKKLKKNVLSTTTNQKNPIYDDSFVKTMFGWVLILLYWTVGGISIVINLLQKNPDSIIVLWAINTPFIVFLILTGFLKKKKTGQWNFRIFTKLFLGISSFILLIIATVIILKYQSDCYDRIAPGSSLCNCRFEEYDFSGKDLHGADLTGVVFYKANLRGANLSNTNLTDADLSEANLNNANLTNANLTNANLLKADMTNIIISNAMIDGANMQGTIGFTDDMLIDIFKITKYELASILTIKKIRFESEETISDSLKNVRIDHGMDRAADYKPDSNFHPVIVLDSCGKTNSFSDDLPEDWQPMAIRFCELVVHTIEGKDETQTCPYSNGTAAHRYQYTLNVKVITAKTGTAIADTVFYGSEPGDCPETTTSKSDWDISGNSVSFEVIKEWLKKYVNPPMLNDENKKEKKYLF